MNKTVFITGASSGIGLTTVNYFLEMNWNVACTIRDMSKTELLPVSQNLKIYKLDITDFVSAKKIANDAWNDFDGIDVVVNNAGYGAIGPFEGATKEQILKQIETNFIGLCNVTQAFIPLFASVNKGMFINLSSIAGRIGLPLYSIYNASKFAVEGLSESLYYELRTKGIKIKLIEPGPIKTEFNGRSRVDITTSSEQGYDEFVKKTDSFYCSLFENAPEPITVAKTIYKAAVNKGNKFRYQAGIQAKMFIFLKKIIPASWFRVAVKIVLGI